MNAIARKAVFSAITVLLVILFVETTLHLFALLSPRVDTLLKSPWAAVKIPDERLVRRPNPAFPGHDSNGFRNPVAPAKVDVVALGDSQTYGTGVATGEAWPRQLEPMIAKTVYSMAYGGYGPVHSLILWDEAIALDPEIIIEALYSGNDLYDAFNVVYNDGQHVELKSPDPQVQSSVRELEESESIKEHVTRMFKMGATRNPSTRKVSPPPLAFLSQRSKIYALLRRMRYEFSRFLAVSQAAPQDPWEKAKVFAEKHAEYTQIFDNDQFRTVFTSEYRFQALNLEDPRIGEGSKLALRAIQRMKKHAADRNIRFIVVLIPTKELVFQQLWSNPSSTYLDLTENEIAFWKMTRDFLERNGIEYVDALPALREQLATGVQPYQVSHDGHPNAHGHWAIANQISAFLKERH